VRFADVIPCKVLSTPSDVEHSKDLASDLRHQYGLESWWDRDIPSVSWDAMKKFIRVFSSGAFVQHLEGEQEWSLLGDRGGGLCAIHQQAHGAFCSD